MQALKHDHTQFVCNALWVWKPMQIHQGRCNVIKALQAKNQNEQQNSTQTVAAGQETKANAQEHYYSNPTDYEPKHAPRGVLIQQTRPSLIDGSTEFGNNSSGKHARHAEDIVILLSSITPKSLTVWTGAMRLPKSVNVILNKAISSLIQYYLDLN